MLGEDYPRLLGRLIQALPQRIELPPELEGFLEEGGLQPSYNNDIRRSARNRVRTHGLLLLQKTYPALDRQPQLMTIYTMDFSKTGLGFLTPEQFYPGEVVQVYLATFWVRVTIRRCLRLGRNCFTNGVTLLDRHDPDQEAIRLLAQATQLQFA